MHLDDKETIKSIHNYKNVIKRDISPILCCNIDFINIYKPKLCGGAFYSYFKEAMDFSKTDFDLFFPNRQLAIKADKYFRAYFEVDDKKTGYSVSKLYKYKNYKFNIVTHWHGSSVEDICQLFDYYHVCNGYDFATDKFWINELSIDCIKNKILKICDMNNITTRKIEHVASRYAKLIYQKELKPTFKKEDIGLKVYTDAVLARLALDNA